MTRGWRWGAAALIASVGALAAGGAALLAPVAGHNRFHVNCPPGSHGKPWSADHAKAFNAGRRQTRATGVDGNIGDNAPRLGDRAVTAGRP